MALEKPLYINPDFDPNDAYKLAKSLDGDAIVVNFNIPLMNKMADLAFTRMFIELTVSASHINEAEKIFKVNQDKFSIFLNYYSYDEIIMMIENILNILRPLPFRHQFLVITNWTQNPTWTEAVIVSTPV